MRNKKLLSRIAVSVLSSSMLFGGAVLANATEVAVSDTQDSASQYSLQEDGNDTVRVTGTIEWFDDDNQNGVRPDSITINLLADGNIIDSTAVSKDTKRNIIITNETIDVKVGEAFAINTTHSESVNVQYGLDFEEITSGITDDGEAIIEDYYRANEQGVYTIEVSYKDARKTIYTINATQDEESADTEVSLMLVKSGEEFTLDIGDCDDIELSDGLEEVEKEDEESGQKTFIAQEDGTYTITITYGENDVLIYTINSTESNPDDSESGNEGTEGETDTDSEMSAPITGGDDTNVEIVESDNDDENIWEYEFDDLAKYSGETKIEYTVATVQEENYRTEIDGYNILSYYDESIVSESSADEESDISEDSDTDTTSGTDESSDVSEESESVEESETSIETDTEYETNEESESTADEVIETTETVEENGSVEETTETETITEDTVSNDTTTEVVESDTETTITSSGEDTEVVTTTTDTVVETDDGTEDTVVITSGTATDTSTIITDGDSDTIVETDVDDNGIILDATETVEPDGTEILDVIAESDTENANANSTADISYWLWIIVACAGGMAVVLGIVLKRQTI